MSLCKKRATAEHGGHAPRRTTDGAQGLEEYCSKNVETMGVEAEHVSCTALSQALALRLRIVYLDAGSSFLSGESTKCQVIFPTLSSRCCHRKCRAPQACTTAAAGSGQVHDLDERCSDGPPGHRGGLPSGRSEDEPFLVLLFRPGHYDMLMAAGGQEPPKRVLSSSHAAKLSSEPHATALARSSSDPPTHAAAITMPWWNRDGAVPQHSETEEPAGSVRYDPWLPFLPDRYRR